MLAATFLAALLGLGPCAPSSAADNSLHVVSAGETLWSIARSAGIGADELAAANGIAIDSGLKVGQRLLIPNIHKVAKGETLYGIARSVGATVDEIRTLNKLSATAVIKVGDNLILPPATSSVPRGAAARQPGTTGGDAGNAPTGPAGSSDAADGGQTPAGGNGAGSGKGGSGGAAADSSASATASVSVTTTGGGRPVSANALLPAPGKARYLDGKVFGIAVAAPAGTPIRSVVNGTVVSAGPYRGFGSVLFVQTRSGLIHVYGGASSLAVRVGDSIKPGQIVGTVGKDPLTGLSEAYFFLFRGGKALDPATAPRE